MVRAIPLKLLLSLAASLCSVAVGYRMRTNPLEHIIYFFGCMEFYQSKLDLKAKVHFYKIRDENGKLEMEWKLKKFQI